MRIVPTAFMPNRISITTISPECLGVTSRMGLATGMASATWPTSNLMIAVPMTIRQVIPVAKLWVVNGTAVSGNIDVAILDSAGARLVSSGSTAQAGTSAVQVFDTTDIVLTPGLYYLALAMDNTTGTVFSKTPAAAGQNAAMGMAQVASDFPIGATNTLALDATAFLPYFGLAQRSNI